MESQLVKALKRPMSGLLMLGGLLALALVATPVSVNSSLQLVAKSAVADDDHEGKKKYKKHKKKEHKKYKKHKYDKKGKYKNKCKKFKAKYERTGNKGHRDKVAKYCGKWQETRDDDDRDDESKYEKKCKDYRAKFRATGDEKYRDRARKYCAKWQETRDDDDRDDDDESKYEKKCKDYRAKFRKTGDEKYRDRARKYCAKWREARDDDQGEDNPNRAKYEEACKENRTKFRETGKELYRDLAKTYCQRWRDAGGEDDRGKRRPSDAQQATEGDANDVDPDLSRYAKADTNGFANHGQEVKNRVQMAKQMGLNPSVGAQAANHGDMYDALKAAEREDLIEDLVDAKDELKLAREIGDPTAMDLAKQEIKDVYGEINNVVPQNGYSNVDMDANGDGKFDAADLEAQRLLGNP